MSWTATRPDGKPLGPFELTDGDLKDVIRVTPIGTPFTYRDYIEEYDRRTRNRQARASFLLSIVSVIIAVAAIIRT